MSTPSFSVSAARSTLLRVTNRRSDVGDLAALVLEEQLGALRVGDDLRLVGAAVDDLAVLDGGGQRDGRRLPLCATRAGVRTGDFPLRGVTCHGLLSSVFSAARRALGARCFVVVVWGVFLERGPAWIGGHALLGSGAHGAPLARDRVKARAIRFAHRLKRKRQDGRIPDQSFKIHVVVLNLEVSCFLPRIREKLLKLDLDTLGDVVEAAAADAGVPGVDRSRGE